MLSMQTNGRDWLMESQGTMKNITNNQIVDTEKIRLLQFRNPVCGLKPVDELKVRHS